MVRIKVHEGVLEGSKVDNVYGKPYFSFKGIPYAEPPVGDLRFKGPKPKTPWTGVREAKEHGPESCQYDLLSTQSAKFKGEENCLYLNVYTPNIEPADPLPVMVYIHGGGFNSGSGNSDQYEPEFLIKHNVILVTINYRLDILGFLCLDTEDIPGNAGMKDQVAALRWVQNNISYFGGDPENVTIFGESAGAASVSAHLVSPMTKGLFKRAIMQSGTSLCPWVQTYGARDRAILLARELGCECKNDKEIFEFYKNQPAEDLVNKKVPINFTEAAKLTSDIYFGPVAEKKIQGQECFIEGDLFDLMQNGIHEGIEIINGYTEDEGIIYFESCNADRMFEQVNQFVQFLVPDDIVNHVPVDQQMILGKKMKKFYFNDQFVNKEHHFDEFLKFLKVDIKSKTYKMIEQITKLWTNFAKYGNPTPDDSLGAQWLPYTAEQKHYLDIGEELTPGTSPDEEQMMFWEEIYREYCPQKLW
ncbi:esterase FE4-like [Zerene cesonia]|uniref:esterase FE4-like n=1 Tax=Zerene cesonia TaxID=33412 RepID=UPI0018E56778|nr:esterase FE4-like [Zerene cesonia]